MQTDKPKQWKIDRINELLYSFDSGTLRCIYKALSNIKEEAENGTQRRNYFHIGKY